MTVVGLAAFNLLLNAIPAFVLALAFSSAITRLMHVPPGRARLVLASLPYLKLAYDLGNGIPDRAFLWQRVAGVPRDVGVFQIGAGTEWGLLRIDMALGALSDGTQYPDSAADIVSALLTRKVSGWAPLAIASVLLAVAAVRLAVRARDWLRAAMEARALRAGLPIGQATWRSRSFPIYLHGRGGSPFSGGLLRGYICFPRGLWHSLPPDERAAAVAHELGHLVERHLWLLLFTGVIEDLFWFVPGVARAGRRLSAAIESAADQWAIDRDHAPATLASALVRVAETATTRFTPGTCGANGASLTTRITALLEPSPAPRLGCHRPLVRAAIALWATGSLLIAVTFGNH